MRDLLYFIAGEKSGDQHGAELIGALDLPAYGVGGAKMQAKGLIPLAPFEDFQVMGFSDVIAALPRLWHHFYSLADHILQNKPKGVIFIDYPGFNLRLARYLRKKGYEGKLIHYIAPSVWAWGKNRIETMSSTLDLLLTIFPFEPPYFAHTPLRTVYVGNPLMQEGFSPKREPKPLVALFPGSRLKEIERNLPLQLEAAKLFLDKHPHFEVVVSLSDPRFTATIEQMTSHRLVLEENRYDLMQHAAIALAKSGTTTLELALSGCPTVVMYPLTRLNYCLARYVFNVSLPFYALPNILLNESLFPEHYQVTIAPETLAKSMEETVKKREQIHTKAYQLQQLLTPQNASETAAKEILNLW